MVLETRDVKKLPEAISKVVAELVSEVLSLYVDWSILFCVWLDVG